MFDGFRVFRFRVPALRVTHRGMLTAGEVALMELARDQHQVFRRRDAIKCGLSDQQIEDRVAAGRFVALHWGVFTLASAPPSFRRDLMAALLAAGPRAFASGRAAARLHGLPYGIEEIVEITCPRWRRDQHARLIVHERLRVLDGDYCVVDGIRCSRAELTLIEIAAVLGPDWAERVFHAIRRERLGTYASMHAMFRRHARRGTPGIAAVRKLLERYEPQSAPTESELETTVLQTIRRLGFPEPETQVVVHDAAGRFVGRADFGYRELRIVILYHSRTWHVTDEDNERDDSQRNAYWRAKWIPIVVRWNDIRAGGQELAGALREAIDIRRSQAPNMRGKSVPGTDF
jgi:hypothetical protein